MYNPGQPYGQDTHVVLDEHGNAVFSGPLQLMEGYAQMVCALGARCEVKELSKK